ncbi:MAG: ATP-binding protein [Chitinophagaceae bacterium]|nr:ATP-binding protein [Chitinophagaceae bacterium]
MNEEQLLEDLLKEGESDHLEFKEVVRKDDVAKVLCSFLNGKGGRILIGISDKGKVVGVSNAAKHVEELKIFLLSGIIPEAPINIAVDHIADKEILTIKVYVGSKQPYLFDGSIYYRKGPSTVKATSQQISELIHGRQKAEQHWSGNLLLALTLKIWITNLSRQPSKKARKITEAIIRELMFWNFSLIMVFFRMAPLPMLVLFCLLKIRLGMFLR